MNDEPNDDDTGTDDERELAALLRAAGARMPPPPGMAEAMRTAVAAEWRVTVASRAAAMRRRRLHWVAAAASVAVAGVAVWLALPRLVSPHDVATVARLDGPVEIRRGDDGSWQPLDARRRLQAGDDVRTGVGGRVALRRADGLELRLDAGTMLALTEADEATLETGRVYVDTGTGHVDDFVVATALGDVRHLGTQYSAALGAGALEVAVREGRVRIAGRREPIVAQAGEAMTVAAYGTMLRRAISPNDRAWGWAQAIAPVFVIDGRSLNEFLGWAARETGSQLVYASSDAARMAEGTELKGSVAGMAPASAVAAVMTTTPALRHRFAGGQLRIERAVD